MLLVNQDRSTLEYMICGLLPGFFNQMQVQPLSSHEQAAPGMLGGKCEAKEAGHGPPDALMEDAVHLSRPCVQAIQEVINLWGDQHALHHLPQLLMALAAPPQQLHDGFGGAAPDSVVLHDGKRHRFWLLAFKPAGMVTGQ